MRSEYVSVLIWPIEKGTNRMQIRQEEPEDESTEPTVRRLGEPGSVVNLHLKYIDKLPATPMS